MLQLSLSCKGNKCSDAGTGDFCVLNTINHVSPLMIPAQPAPGEYHHKQCLRQTLKQTTPGPEQTKLLLNPNCVNKGKVALIQDRIYQM